MAGRHIFDSGVEITTYGHLEHTCAIW